MLKLLFRTGFPTGRRMGQYKLYVFEIMLSDGTTREAVADTSMCGDVEDLHWKDPKTRVVIPQTTVLGWRETYNCDAARQDIDEYFKRPISIVARDHLGDSFTRHMTPEFCYDCKEYFDKKSKPPGSEITG